MNTVQVEGEGKESFHPKSDGAEDNEDYKDDSFNHDFLLKVHIHIKTSFVGAVDACLECLLELFAFHPGNLFPLYTNIIKPRSTPCRPSPRVGQQWLKNPHRVNPW